MTRTNVVIFTGGFDTGGQGWRLKHAFDRYQPDFNVRSVHSNESYFNFPSDVRYRPTEAYRIFDEAHVIHMRNNLAGLKRLRGHATSEPFGLVLHHHGTLFREEHKVIATRARAVGALQVASTIDLTLLEPDVVWLPSPFDIQELMALRMAALPRPEDTPFRIAHAPTNRKVKSTEVLMDAVLELNRRGIPTVLDLIERRTYADCLARKAKADIYFDQLDLGYGNNAVEAWGMVMPVVAGTTNPLTREAMIACWGGLPFVEATRATLVERLAELATDLALRAHWAAIGYKHAVAYHADDNVAALLACYYREALCSTTTVEVLKARAS